MKLGNSFDGISFIIPSDGAYPILLDMKDGVTLTDTRRTPVATHAAKMGVLGESFSEGGILGVKIADFASDDCDAAKKLRLGDVIVSVEKKPVKNAIELSRAINEHAPGETISVTVYRSGQLLTFSIILGK